MVGVRTRYTTRFETALNTIDASGVDAPAKLTADAGLNADVLSAN